MKLPCRIAKDKDGTEIKVPVIDMRESEQHRKIGESFLKLDRINRGSKFLRPTFSVVGRSYQVSQKKLPYSTR